MASHAQEWKLLREGQYVDILAGNHNPAVKGVIGNFVGDLLRLDIESNGQDDELKTIVGLAAFNAFLQMNITGPMMEGVQKVERVFVASAGKTSGLKRIRKTCLGTLDVDGVSVYSYIPSIELFCLARWVFAEGKGVGGKLNLGGEGEGEEELTAAWLALRIHVWHYKLLTQPALGPGSIFIKSAQWSDVPSLEDVIERQMGIVEGEVGKGVAGVQFLVEKANVHIMLGQDVKAKEALTEATRLNGFVYALSGAMGKRTKWQEKGTSQLVVLARSGRWEGGEGKEGVKPVALNLNDDTLLESLEFSKEGEVGLNGEVDGKEGLPLELRDLSPDEQPQLSPLDQIILLSEATLKDAFSPADSLTSEEILPFAVRVISDTATNWQIYTQALVVRSRIEVHRSRTLERGVLQMQAVVDQVIVDTAVHTVEGEERVVEEVEEEESGVPVIKVSQDGDDEEEEEKPVDKPTSFFPAAKPSESAPAQVRLRYLHCLNSAPRWHLEAELAYSWAGVGSLISALEIFKRLRLWAEVALCFASAARTEDEDGRGSGGEEKAKAVLRWRLFHRTGSSGDDQVDEDANLSELKAADFQGQERNPPPPNAPRLLCILGDIESNPAHYERAWEISGHRFARAQKSLGEHYLQQQDIPRAKEAYEKAVKVNRLSSEMWGRLGDINLRLGNFADAAEAFGKGIASADNLAGGEDARTWSNLGSALYSQYVERVKELKKEKEEKTQQDSNVAPEMKAEKADDEEDDNFEVSTEKERASAQQDPSTLLSQALSAFKRGANISRENWRIWDNVLTLASRLRPPAVSDMILALQNIIKIRKTEDTLDVDVLRLLLNQTVLSVPKSNDSGKGVYEPPRGSQARAVCELLETSVVPIITTRSELWEIITRERVWKRDYAGAIESAERAWRAAVGTAGSGVSGGGGSLAPSAAKVTSTDWLEDKEAWKVVVERTDDLVSVLENYGEEVPEIGAKWKGKARSAIRSVLGKAKENWEGSEEWERLKALLEGLK